MMNMPKITPIAFTFLLALVACGDRAEYVTSQGEFATSCADDASADAGPDAALDATTDASPESSTDAASEAAVDAAPEASDDASAEASTDAAVEAAAEAGPIDASVADTGSDGSTADSGLVADAGTDAGAALPYIRQAGEITLVGDNPAVDSVTLGTPVLAGSTVLVLAYDEFFGTASQNPNPKTVNDTQGGTYTVVVSHLVDVDTDASEQAWYRTNVAAGTLTTTVHYGGGSNQWHSVVVAEVANVLGTTIGTASKAYTFASNPPTTANFLSSTGMALGTTAGFVVGFAVNDDDYGPADPGFPLTGAGFAQFGTYTNWHGAEGTSPNNSAILASAYFPSGGTHPATFTRRAGGEDAFFVLAVSFQ